MPSPIYYSINEFDGDGVTTVRDFNFAGGYIDQTHVKALVRDTFGAATDIPLTPASFISEFRLTLPVIPVGHTLRVYRETPREEPLVNFTGGSNFTEANLDVLARQVVMCAAEAFDAGAYAGANDLLGAAQLAASQAAAALSAAISAEAEATGAAASAALSAGTAAAQAALASVDRAATLGYRNDAGVSSGLATAARDSAVSAADMAEDSAAAATGSAASAGASAANAGASSVGAAGHAATASTKAAEASSSASSALTSAASAQTSATAAATFIPANFVAKATDFASAAQNAAGTAEQVAVDPLGVREAVNAAGAAPIHAVRARLTFTGATAAIKASSNIATVSRLGAGRYRVTFSVAPPDANYVVITSGNQDNNPAGAADNADAVAYTNKTATGFDITAWTTSANPADLFEVSAICLW